LTRKVIIAAKEAEVGYFIMIGGCGSLHMPGNRLQTCSESKNFWLWYRRGIADSHAHVAYMEERLGSMGSSLRTYRNARILERQGQADDSSKDVIEKYEKAVLEKDSALEFVTAGRTSFMFFDGNTSFRWTFVSPPALYRSGKRTGSYEVIIDELPIKPAMGDEKNLDGRLHGISASDLAIAIVDEAEQQTLVGKHWSAFGDMSDDAPVPSYVTF
jgi:putative NADH-flavin reductase